MITVEHIKCGVERSIWSDFAPLHQNSARSYAGLRMV